MKNTENIRKSLEYIENNLSKPINHVEVANALHYSPYYFHRIFSAATGKTIAAHIREKRLEQAGLLLLCTDKKILEICIECGFNSPQSFNPAFKAKYELSPGNYRKKHEKDRSIIMAELLCKIKTLNEKIVAEPKNADLFNERGEVYFSIGKHDDAFNDFLEAVKINPTKNWFYANLRNSISNMGKSKIEQLTQQIIQQPENADLLNKRGTIYFYLDERDKAVNDIKRALDINPAKTEYLTDYGNALAHMGNHDEAVIYHTKALENGDFNEFCYFFRGLSYQHLSNHEKAVEDFTKALEYSPDNAVYYECREISYGYIDAGITEERLAELEIQVQTT